MEPNRASFNGLTIFHKNQVELDFLVEEIFGSDTYAFESSRASPLIVDCGAHIGISVLYFKSLFPNSRIIAFEPDPANFELLKMNIAVNRLGEVEIHQLALSGSKGTRSFYGDFTSSSESVGNTLDEHWGERPGFERIEVASDRLSNYITEPIEYLKMDIEGAEEEVLSDIESKLEMVRSICVEVHEIGNNGATYESVAALLSKAGFVLSSEELEVKELLYKRFPDWVTKYGPAIYMVRGENANADRD